MSIETCSVCGKLEDTDIFEGEYDEYDNYVCELCSWGVSANVETFPVDDAPPPAFVVEQLREAGL